jgi:integrase
MITLEEHLASWLISSKSSISTSTWKHYKSLIRTYVNPEIGSVKLQDLRPDQIQSLYDSLLTKGVGIWTVIKIHTMLHSALTQAVKLGIISRNPASNTMPPKEPTSEMRILDENQVSLMLIAAKDTRWEALLLLAVTTGMRQMELLGLKWSDLDWVKQTLKVERQLDRSKRNGVQFSLPKTRFGRRTLTLGAQMIEVLRAHNERQHVKRKVAGDRWQDYGLIFSTRYGGPIHYRNLLRDFKKLLRNAGLPEIRFHDLRHTAASLMLNNGVDVIMVSRRLGHAKPSITLDVYGHLIPSMQAGVAEMLDELIIPVEILKSTPNYTRSTPDLPLENISQDSNPHI